MVDSSPREARHHKPQPMGMRSGDGLATDVSTIADLIAIVQQLCFENKRLGDQLVERRLEVEDLHDDLCMFLRGQNAKLKRLYRAIGQEGLYYASSPRVLLHQVS